MIIPLKQKYRPNGRNIAKKCGINGDHHGKSTRRKVGRRGPAPVPPVLVLGPDMKRRWEKVS